LNISADATVDADALYLGTNGSSGLVSLNGGALIVTNSDQSAVLDVVGGTLSQSGGTLTADYLIVTNQAGVVAFSNGQMTLGGSVVSNGAPFVVGDGADPATLNLPSGLNTFANGLVISTGATLSIGCAQINGPVLNEGTISSSCPGGIVVMTGSVTNNATITANPGQTIEFRGPLVNNGTLAESSGGAIHYFGSVVNNGTISNVTVSAGLIWEPWSEIPGGMTTTNPAQCVVSDANLYLFVQRDTDGLGYYNVYNGADWGGWNPSGSPAIWAATATLCNPIFAFGPETTNSLLFQKFDGVTWTQPIAIPGNALQPARANALAYGGYVYLFLKTSSPNLYMTRFDGISWFYDYLQVPGPIAPDTGIGSVKYNRNLYLFAKTNGSANGQISFNQFDNVNWSGWTALPGAPVTETSTAAAVYQQQLYLFAKGLGNQTISLNVLSGTNWQGWSPVPGGAMAAAAPAASEFRSQLELFRVDPNRRIYVANAVSGPPPPQCLELSVIPASSGIVLAWDGIGSLQTASQVTGPWTEISGAASPWPIAPSKAQAFFRLVRDLSQNPGLPAGVCVTEVPLDPSLTNSALVRGDWVNFDVSTFANIPAGPTDEEEAEMLTNNVMYGFPNRFELGPGQTQQTTVQLTGPALFWASADSYGSPIPVSLEIFSGTNLVGTAAGTSIDATRATAKAILLLTNSASVTVRVNNSDVQSLTVFQTLESTQGKQ
jgi:hypothetical protein